MMTLLWIKVSEQWYTIAQGSSVDINESIKTLTRLYPHMSYKTQSVDDYELFSKHFLTKPLT